MTYYHPKYYAKLRKIYKQAETDKQAASLKLDHSHWGLPRVTSNQQASKVSSTVDHDPRAIDEQAKPSLKSSWILDPGTSIMVPWPWCLAKIKVSFGCVVWKAIWCGENLILLLFVTFNSTVKKCLEALYPKQSGIPIPARFSIRFHIMEGQFFLRSWYNFLSGPIAYLQ